MVVSIFGLNSFINIDYEKVNTEQIYIFNNGLKFKDEIKYKVCIIVFKRV